MSAPERSHSVTGRSTGLGTFGGVFTPSLLTILGVIMFLRFGFVTGTAGLDRTIAIVLVANLVSILTSLSLAVIATNTRVEGGGDYYLISRSLGLEFGGAIGSVLYLAQSVSVGFYVVGFTEALAQTVGGFHVPPTVFGQAVPAALRSLEPTSVARLVSTAVCLLLFVLTYRGADIATKFQYVIMATLAAALVSYFHGALPALDPALVAANRAPAEPGLPFWTVFAIFFPAITGFTQGVSMSGDLKDPGRSLPRGTFAAVGLSLLVYLTLPVLLAGTTTRGHLVGDPGAVTMKVRASVPWLIDAGVFAATLSSALASFLGAPRILQAMSRDALFPGSRFFAEAGRPHAEPRRAVAFTLLIALACIWGGELNTIATVVSMFFLLSYGALNYATFVEGFARNPSFRPRFRLSGWRTSLTGAVVCAAVMLAIDPMASVIAGLVLAALHRYLDVRGLESPGGDSRRGYYMQRIKGYLLKLGRSRPHPRNWRPVVLAVTRRGEAASSLVRFGQAIAAQQGILTVSVVLVGRFKELIAERQREIESLQNLVGDGASDCFYEVGIADSYAHAIRGLLQAHGIGQVRANTLLLSWSESLSPEYVNVLQDATVLRVNVVLFHPLAPTRPGAAQAASLPSGRGRQIDVWWRGLANGSLALLLAHLVRQTREWRGSRIRLLRIVSEQAESHAGEQEMADLARSSRIDAEPTVVHSQRPPFDVIVEESAASHLVFLGIGGIARAERDDLERYNALLPRLPATVLVRAADDLRVEV